MITLKTMLDISKVTNSLLGKPFEWGKTDCSVITVELMDVVRGTNDYDDIHGEYNSKRSAIRWARSKPKGYGNISEYCEGIGCSRVKTPKYGDILIETHPKTFDNVGFCLGHLYISSDEKEGKVVIRPTSILLDKVDKIWRI